MNFGNEDSGLKTVNVNRVSLISSIKNNKEKHILELSVSRAEREESIITTLSVALKDAKNGSFKSELSFPEVPDHVDDYTSVIEMLEFSVDDEVSVTVEQFQRYVRDKWSWKQSFIAASSLYKR